MVAKRQGGNKHRIQWNQFCGMVAAKVFLITVHLQIHNVYCRGARLRPYGPIRLLALTSHSNAATRTLLPAFPLLIREELTFRQVVQCGSDLQTLDQHLKKEVLKLQLVQGDGNLVLAQLTTSLARVLFPKHPLKWLRDGVEMELVMTPTSRFQSAVGPRIEISTKLVIEYLPEEKLKVVDLSATESCQCAEEEVRKKPATCACQHERMLSEKNDHHQDHRDHFTDDCQVTSHGKFYPHVGHNCRGGKYDCEICEAYDMLVRRRYTCESASPWLRKHI